MPAALQRLTRPLARFLRIESASGVVLLACTAVALAMANSPAAGWWDPVVPAGRNQDTGLVPRHADAGLCLHHTERSGQLRPPRPDDE